MVENENATQSATIQSIQTNSPQVEIKGPICPPGTVPPPDGSVWRVILAITIVVSLIVLGYWLRDLILLVVVVAVCVGIILAVMALLVLMGFSVISWCFELILGIFMGRQRARWWMNSLTARWILNVRGELILIKRRALFLNMVTIAWSAFRYPFSTTTISYSTGRIVRNT